MSANRYQGWEGCEHHDGPGECTEECVALSWSMSAPGAHLPYDPTGCSYPPPLPEVTFHLDADRRIVVATYDHPEDCTCGQDDCPPMVEEAAWHAAHPGWKPRTMTLARTADLKDGDEFSTDNGITWHTAAVVLFGNVAVYASDSRDFDTAPTVRVTTGEYVMVPA